MLMQEMMSMVKFQKWRNPTMSVRLMVTMRTTMKQIWMLQRRRKVTSTTTAMERPRFRHNSAPIMMSVSQLA